LTENKLFQEEQLSRIINTQGVGKERNRLVKAIVISIRALMRQKNPDSTTRDLAAFIAIALEAVSETVERTVIPWEKRNYWVKADKFRQEWAWAKPLSVEMKEVTLKEDWASVAGLAAQIGSKLKKVEVSDNHRMGKPWIGAWQTLGAKENGDQ
jgi:hypothetical protein